jgi:hypothetical protein
LKGKKKIFHFPFLWVKLPAISGESLPRYFSTKNPKEYQFYCNHLLCNSSRKKKEIDELLCRIFLKSLSPQSKEKTKSSSRQLGAAVLTY